MKTFSKRHPSMKLVVIVIVSLFATTIFGQLINIKTIPVATGDQFLIYPSENLGMGGVSIALDDSLLEPFVNPARGEMIKQNMIIGTPSSYLISNELGSAQTLPLSVFAHSQDWYGTVSLAIQEVTPSTTNQDLYSSGNGVLDNSYFSASLGRSLSSTMSLGLSINWARIKSIGGVEYLYGDASRIEQKGKLIDFRVGLSAKLNKKSTLETIILYNKYDLTHYVSGSWVNWRVNSSTVRMPARFSGDENLDQTHTIGLHFRYTQPITENLWRFGSIFTINRKLHPKIPNYTLMNIPRDPGESWASNIGVGLARQDKNAKIGIDFIYEPIWSHTWADRQEPDPFNSFRPMDTGERIVDNYFTFSNWILRLGLGARNESNGFDLGFEVRKISYKMEQKRYGLESRTRLQNESWYEYTASLGLHFNFKIVRLSYTARAILGTGTPAGFNDRIVFNGAGTRSATFYTDFIPAPNSEINFDEVKTISHRLMLAVPIGN